VEKWEWTPLFFCPEKRGKIFGKMGKWYYRHFYIRMKGKGQKIKTSGGNKDVQHNLHSGSAATTHLPKLYDEPASLPSSFRS
jgi:hypothetical protein